MGFAALYPSYARIGLFQGVFEQLEDPPVFVVPRVRMDEAVALHRIRRDLPLVLAQLDQALRHHHRVLEEHVVVDHAMGGQQAAARSSESLAAYPSLREPTDPPVTVPGRFRGFFSGGGAVPSALSIASATVSWTTSMSGSAVLMSGGTSETEEIFCPRALSARSMKRPNSEPGRFVENMSVDADASDSKLVSTVLGFTCDAKALITHFWRAIRE